MSRKREPLYVATEPAAAARPTLYYACLETRHFTFEAVDASEDLARAAIKRVWDAHRAQYEASGEIGVRMYSWAELKDDVNVWPMQIGVGYRDHSEVRS